MTRWTAVAAGLLLLTSPLGMLSAQQDPPAEPAAGNAEAQTGSEAGEAQDAEGGEGDPAPLPGGSLPDVTPIDEIFEEDESVIAGGGYTYDQGDRRDPFRSLLERRTLAPDKGPRPEGKAGLLIDELTISGIFYTPEGSYAQVLGGSTDKSYLLRAGDELYDGDVVAVEPDQVVFKQMIDDPAAIKPFREVIKPLDEK